MQKVWFVITRGFQKMYQSSHIMYRAVLRRYALIPLNYTNITNLPIHGTNCKGEAHMALTAKKVYAILKRQISDMESKIKTPVIYKGTVTTADLLPLNPSIGDMYNIEQKSIYGEAGMNVAWNGVVWDTMGAPIDMAPYLREDSEIITSLKTKTENLESANYTDRGTLADTDAFLINDGTGMKKSVLSKLSDFVLNKIADKVFAKLQTNDKTILGAINELNSKALMTYVGKKATNEDGVIPINNIISGVSIKNVINAKAYISDGNKNIYSRLYSYNSYAYILVTDYEGNRFKNTELNVVVLYTK
nr:MAG TPA: hypothetical protein [Caudoviricetes sp.]